MSGLEDVNSLDETAAYLRIAPATLVRLARARKIGSLKQGRVLTFPRECVEEYVAGNIVRAVASNPHGLTDRAVARMKARAS